jgi:hypothetical protein
MRIDITAMFACLDDFSKAYEASERSRLLPRQGRRERAGYLSLGEMLLIVVLYHFSAYKDFKHFYQYGVCKEYRDCFRQLPCYERFIQLLPRLFVPLCMVFHALKGEETGIYFVDSTCLPVCHNNRRYKNKVFKGVAESSKSTMGWFYGFKLHLVTNHKGEIVALKITKGNVDDRDVLDDMTAHLTGKIAADKGYISPSLFKKLYARGLHLIVGIRKNMKNHLMPTFDKWLLRKRHLIETTNGILKCDMDISHTRHRSPQNAFVHIIATIVAYAFKTNKPHLKTNKLSIA